MTCLAMATLSLTNVAWAEISTESSVNTNEVQKNKFEQREEQRKAFEEKRAAMQVSRQEETEKRVAEKCAMIQAKIAERNTKFEGNKAKHTAVYSNMTERISKFITRLSGEGYDVSKVKADLEILKEKISKLESDLATQNAKMNETKDFACGHSDGDFKGKLVEARTMMQTIHAEAMEVRKFVQTTIRPDIQALRTQKVETKKATEGGVVVPNENVQ